MSDAAIDAYTRRKFNLINQREGTNYGEDYYMLLREEVAREFQYSDLTLAAAREKGGLMLTLLVTFADDDQVYTRFNGTREEAIAHYSQNNLLNNDPCSRVASVRFGPDDVHKFSPGSFGRTIAYGFEYDR